MGVAPADVFGVDFKSNPGSEPWRPPIPKRDVNPRKCLRGKLVTHLLPLPGIFLEKWGKGKKAGEKTRDSLTSGKGGGESRTKNDARSNSPAPKPRGRSPARTPSAPVGECRACKSVGFSAEHDYKQCPLSRFQRAHSPGAGRTSSSSPKPAAKPAPPTEVAVLATAPTQNGSE